ncbi:hypothetical protein BsIDN1_45970 [Bacillus safensis]|uniref:Uncharacterized protein n=1 Tax=Bacillus safensis TaxID=561879 RepID=A0A5S9MGP0_BACIA|nr:hypothetical protein BsIDN1_45970 [Bacillus safensis]
MHEQSLQKITDSNISIDSFMTKGEVKVIILDGSNNVVLAETPMYGKNRDRYTRWPVHKFKLYKFSQNRYLADRVP